MVDISGLTGFLPFWWCVTVVLVLLRPVRADDISGCLCASDILSCTTLDLDGVPREMPVSTVTLDLSHNRIERLQVGSFEGLSRLETLRLAHNQLSVIQQGAFRNSSGSLLRHLDLSSNQLRVLEQHYFHELPGLEELLLFNNQLTHVESGALAELGNLRKAYLSHNRLTDFPFFSIQKHRHAHLTMLDLSSNRLPRLPLEDLSNLPLSVQEGLYLHNNSLVCDCSMYGLFRLWDRRGFASVRLFRHEHICLVYGIQRGSIRFFLHSRYFDKCNLTMAAVDKVVSEQESSVAVKEGSALLLHCATSLTDHGTTFFWVAPNAEYVVPPGNNVSLKMFANGSLEIMAAHEQDSGIYLCMAQDRQRNETREVNVTVVLRHDGNTDEHFNTGFTTLLGCVVSLVLVLMYLYLTPCHCPPQLKRQPSGTATPNHVNDTGAGSVHSSILTPTPPTTTEGPGRKVSTNKHVVFLEPIREQQNGRLRAGPGHMGPGLLLGAEHPFLQKDGEVDSYVSVFSDTHIMMP